MNKEVVRLVPTATSGCCPGKLSRLSDGKYAIEKYDIRYLTSGRDLLPGVAPKVETHPRPWCWPIPTSTSTQNSAKAEVKRLLTGTTTEEQNALAVGYRCRMLLRRGAVRRPPRHGSGGEGHNAPAWRALRGHVHTPPSTPDHKR